MGADKAGGADKGESKAAGEALEEAIVTARSELKGWSFYTKGARWFDPAWFGQEQEGSPAQRQYSQLQAAEYVLRARIKRRAEEQAVHLPGQKQGDCSKENPDSQGADGIPPWFTRQVDGDHGAQGDR